MAEHKRNIIKSSFEHTPADVLSLSSYELNRIWRLPLSIIVYHNQVKLSL
jgi:hypothetical protein